MTRLTLCHRPYLGRALRRCRIDVCDEREHWQGQRELPHVPGPSGRVSGCSWNHLQASPSNVDVGIVLRALGETRMLSQSIARHSGEYTVAGPVHQMGSPV